MLVVKDSGLAALYHPANRRLRVNGQMYKRWGKAQNAFFASAADLKYPRGMTPSEFIRRLIRRFPALKPAAIRRILAARGYRVNNAPVDNNLVVVTRHRDHAWKTELAVARVLGEFSKLRGPDLAIAAANDESVKKLVADLLADNPGLKLAEVAALLDARIAKGEVALKIDHDAERRARIHKKVLDAHPECRKAMQLTFGAKEIHASVHNAPGIETWSDEVLEAFILAELRERYPPADTVEKIAVAVLDMERQAAVATALEAARRERDRTEPIYLLVVKGLGYAPDRDAASKAISAFADKFPEWSDEQIAERIAEGLRHEREADDDPARGVEVEKMRLTSRPR
jgi:hypothetical protein